MAIIMIKILENHQEGILNTIGQAWIFQKNGPVRPQEYTWRDFDANQYVPE